MSTTLLNQHLRDCRIDNLRGILLILMAMNHFRGWWAQYTWQPLGFFSAAEGFVLLSAVMTGLIYHRYYNDNLIWKKSSIRALTLYKYHIVTALLLSIIALTIPYYSQDWMRWLRPLNFDAWRTLFMEGLLIQQPKHLDIIPMYAVFMLLVPALIWLQKAKLFSIIIIASLLLWYFNPHIEIHRFMMLNVCGDCQYGYFNWFSWQLLWVLGVGFGIALATNHRWLTQIKRPTISAALLLIVILLFATKEHWIVFEFLNRKSINRPNLGWLRLINLFCFSLFLYSLSAYFSKEIRLPLVNLLGRNSLQVFTAHVVLLYLLKPLNESILKEGDVIWSTGLMLCVLIIMYAVAWIYEHRIKGSMQATVAEVI